MRPVTLDMTAFGSYVKLEEPVDFRKFEHSLYLITGDTGAGKTTIFDGIMYALYGVASGGETGKKGKQEKRDGTFRTPEMMHCDYVDRSVDSVVRLTFEHMGKTHTVERTIHFRKEQKTGEYKKAVQKAKFWEQDRPVMEKPETVTNRITELLGMNADQFRKIAVLAQGEFKRFLDADSETKNQILGDLFDNSAYVYFQDVIDRAGMKLEQYRQTEGLDRIKRAMEDFRLPEEISEEEKECCTAGHSRLEEILAVLVKRDSRRKKDLEERIRACQEQEKELHIQSGKAEEENRKLDELDEKERHLEELQERTAEMEQLKEQKNRISEAFYSISPAKQLYVLAEKAFDHADREIDRLERMLGELEQKTKKEEEAQKECEEEHRPVAARLEAEIRQIEKELPRYEDLEDRRRAQGKNHADTENAVKQRQEAENHRKRTESEIEKLDEKIKESDGIDVKAERLQREFENASDRLNQLTKEGGVRDQVNDICQQERKLLQEKKALGEITEQAGILGTVYHETYQAFINGQAGILAGELERELLEKKEAACPVCRTVFRGSPLHLFAEVTEEIPKQEEVDRTKAEFERRESQRQEQDKKVMGMEHVLYERKKRVMEKLKTLRPDCPDWETLSGSGYLERIVEEHEAAREEAHSACREAQAQREDLISWKKLLDEKREERKRQDQDLERCKRQEQNLKEERIRLSARIEELKKILRYPDKQTAEDQKRQWEREKEERLEKIQKAAESFRKTLKDYNETAGALETEQKRLPGLKEEKEKAAKSLEDKIRAGGFQNPDEVEDVLQAAGETGADIETWLASKDETIRHYKNDLDSTRNRIRELKKEMEGRKRLDLNQLNERIKNLEEERERLQRERSVCEKQYENHRNTAETVQKAGQALRKTESAWKRINSLADLAMGKRNAAGGKLSFDRYVMGDVFQEVLEMANRQLDIMSGGRYELIHERNAKNQNAKAGLEISVLDMTTGKQRPSSSLSGGESFFVSLSLALGLSDVVQNHAGGKQLDALFIDEGFGSLDSDVLDRALSVLNQLTEGRRLVGIISHVPRLKESIPQQIRVKNSEKGSSLRIIN